MLFQTVTALNYLPMTLVMANSLKAQVPDARLCVLVTDIEKAKIPSLAKAFPEVAEFICCEDLPHPALPAMRDYYYVLEFSSACKVLALDYQLRTRQEPECCFIDPDMLVVGDFSQIVVSAGKDIVVTHHTFAPYPDDGELPNELELVVSGAVNGGLVYVRRSAQSLAALEWLVKRTPDQWFLAPAYGMYCDQQWLSLLPQLFADVTGVLSHRGVNAAYWNLHERPLSRGHKGLKAGTDPLLLFHFSGFAGDGKRLSKHSNRCYDDATNSLVAQMVADYYQAMQAQSARCAKLDLKPDTAFCNVSLQKRMKRAKALHGRDYQLVAHAAGKLGRLGAKLDRLGWW